MTEQWRLDIRAWAEQTAGEFAARPGILGVVIGGSIARGQEWQHSDLELGVLVEERDPGLPHFNIVGGRGVEAIQLVRTELEQQLALVEQGNLSPAAQWPIQLFQCRVISDPSGLLGRFQKAFDSSLFSPEIVQKKVTGAHQGIENRLNTARALAGAHKPRHSAVMTRLAMNDAILGVHWAYNTLPRSQNRTDSRLRQLCRKHDLMPFYEIYREVFYLDDTQKAIKTWWPKVEEPVFEITRLWGDSARDFFAFAVDSDFQWRQNAGILTVYRLFIPIIGLPEQGISSHLDDPAWAKQNLDMLRFLGLAHIDAQAAAHMIESVEAARSFLNQS